MFEVIQYEKQMAATQRLIELIAQGATATVLDPERAGNDDADQGGTIDRRQWHEDDVVAELLGQLSRGLDGQARLANPARAGQREEPHLGLAQETEDGGKLLLPPDQ